MKLTTTRTDNIPLLICGEDSDKAFLFVHGIGGNKEEAIRFAEIAGKHGWQTYAVDLPEHNSRTDPAKLVPWEVIPELRKVMDYIKSRAKSVSVRATSIGAYFSLLAFQGERIDKCLLASPLTDMTEMIAGLMAINGVTDEELRENGEIEVPGQTLSWRYLTFAREHPVRALCETDILYGSNDEIIPRKVIDSFVENNPCRLTVIDSGHWIHTPPAVAEMSAWEDEALK